MIKVLDKLWKEREGSKREREGMFKMFSRIISWNGRGIHNTAKGVTKKG